MDTTIIEVNGVKLECDLRVAKRIDTLKVGTRVKVLAKEYSSHRVYPGVVIGFEPFRKLPTILVAYVESSYATAKVKVVSINAKSEDVELVASIDDELIERQEILALFDKQIADKRQEIAALEEQKSYFLTKFATYWAPVTPVHETAD